MDLINITNQQLYEIMQNIKLDKAIREKASKEFLIRKLDKAEMTMITLDYQDKYKHVNDVLEMKYRILVIVLPFIPLYWFDPFSMSFKSVLAGHFLSKGYNRKWREYWIFSMIGYIIWTIIIIALYKYSK